MSSLIRCAQPGCPHRLRIFTLDWPWRCPEHRRAHEQALAADALARRLGMRPPTPRKGIRR